MRTWFIFGENKNILAGSLAKKLVFFPGPSRSFFWRINYLLSINIIPNKGMTTIDVFSLALVVGTDTSNKLIAGKPNSVDWFVQIKGTDHVKTRCFKWYWELELQSLHLCVISSAVPSKVSPYYAIILYKFEPQLFRWEILQLLHFLDPRPTSVPNTS